MSKKNLTVHFSSETAEWATPQATFDELNKEFSFTLDPCATKKNAKCKKFFTKKDNGLEQSWEGETVFCNPPYGSELPLWVEKCYRESRKPGTTVVMLIPARTDTRYFHQFIYHRSRLRFLKGRLKFGSAKHSAPFPSMVVIYQKRSRMD